MWIVFELRFLNFLLELQIIFLILILPSNSNFPILWQYLWHTTENLSSLHCVQIVFLLIPYETSPFSHPLQAYIMIPQSHANSFKMMLMFVSLWTSWTKLWTSLWTSLRTCLDQFMDQFRPVKTSWYQSRPVWSYLDQFETV